MVISPEMLELVSEMAYSELLARSTSASIASAPLESIESAVFGMDLVYDLDVVSLIAREVERFALDEMESQWADYADIKDQYLL
jgi:hypothetical protein